MFRSPVLTFALVVLAIVLVSAIVRLGPRRIEIEKRLEYLGNQAAELNMQKTAIEKLSDFLNTDAFQEKEARLRYNMQKPGETVVIIETEDAKPTTEQIQSEMTIWQKFKNWLARIF